MQRLTVSIPVCLAILGMTLTAGPLAKVTGTGKSKRFVSRRYGFSVPIPEDWFVSVKGDTPFCFNFRPDKAPGRGALPSGGATLNVIAQEELPSKRGRETLGDWAQTDEDQGISDTVSEHAMELPAETGIDGALWTAFDLKRYSTEEQAQHQVNVYWQFRKRVFATHLIFITGDPHAAELQELAMEMMKGVRPLESN